MNVQPPLVVMSISVGVELGSASVPDVACCNRDSMSDFGCMFIFSVEALLTSIPGMPGISWEECDGPDMSMGSLEVWPAARKTGSMRPNKITRAIRNGFRTNIPPGVKNKMPFRPSGPQDGDWSGLDAERNRTRGIRRR